VNVKHTRLNSNFCCSF